MRPHGHPADGNRLRRYRVIIERYLRYVLIRCLAYTNDRTVGESIAAYTLIASCRVTDVLEDERDLGLIVDTVSGIVGNDHLGRDGGSDKGQEGDKREVTRDQSDKKHVTSDKKGEALFEPTAFVRRGAEDDGGLFYLSAAMCDVAGAINSVDGLGRELLILRHVEGIGPAALAELYRMPVTRIETALADGEREFVGILRGLSWDHDVGPDVHGLLAGLAGCVDEESRRDVADCAMQYLTDCT
jgi:hypothetical protein